MFGPIRGDWDEDWSEWWGPEPPYRAPGFVLTHHRHDPIQMQGGTTFHFVTEGFDAAYSAACAAAEDNGVDIAGGASTVRQALAAGVIDVLVLDIAPVLLGSGERMLPRLSRRARASQRDSESAEQKTTRRAALRSGGTRDKSDGYIGGKPSR